MEKIPLCFHRQINDPTRRKDPASKLFLILVLGVAASLEFRTRAISLEKTRTIANSDIKGVAFSLREQGFSARGELIIPANVKKIPLVFASENENLVIEVFAIFFITLLISQETFVTGKGKFYFGFVKL